MSSADRGSAAAGSSLSWVQRWSYASGNFSSMMTGYGIVTLAPAPAAVLEGLIQADEEGWMAPEGRKFRGSFSRKRGSQARVARDQFIGDAHRFTELLDGEFEQSLLHLF